MARRSKFKFVFANGTEMNDRNGFKSLSGAKAWARASNKNTRTKGWKVVKVVPIRKKRR